MTAKRRQTLEDRVFMRGTSLTGEAVENVRAELSRLARQVRKIDLKKYGFADEMEAMQAVKKTAVELIAEARR